MALQVYKPVDSSAGEIRLLKILPAKKQSDIISCELVYSQLSQTQPYEALSYTWGGPAAPPAPETTINLDSQTFPVFENLFAALLRLRQISKSRIVWIDAICINQEDVREREMQVLLMRRIYEQAEQVVVWLGETGLSERIPMLSLASPNGGFSARLKVWNIQKKFGLAPSLKSRMSQSLTSEWDAAAVEVGEISQLLDRPWWRRVWIVQEVVLAKKAIFMCGSDEVPWEAFVARTRDATFGILGLDANHPLKRTDEGSVVAKYAFPNTEYTILSALQEKWRHRSESAVSGWDESLYSLLYRFRRFECTLPRDRIYAFLGLAKDVEELNIIPDYTSATSKVFTDIARSLIVTHRHLLVFNLKREPIAEQRAAHQQRQIYSVLDQSRFFDPDGLVVEGKSKAPRKGWVRLPHGWERRQDGSRFQFYNHLTKEGPFPSPLPDEPNPLPQKLEHWRSLPLGWTKNWDNVGNVTYTFDQSKSITKAPQNSDLADLPTWVPDWTKWSISDAEPLVSLREEAPCYWASGINRKVHFAAGGNPDSNTLRLTGVLFDKIESLAPPWCPEPHLLPIDRRENKTLQEWEALATAPFPNCPYAASGGRHEAFWRTHIADYAGSARAAETDGHYFEMWANRGEWESSIKDEFNAVDKNSWQKGMATVTQLQILTNMSMRMIEKGYVKASVNVVKAHKIVKVVEQKYKEVRQRVYNASIGRRMFITTKGYIGLAPWSAETGDIVSVLLGGSTPFILRKIPGEEQYKLVGETYVYGIMGGELFDGSRGHARLRSFDII